MRTLLGISAFYHDAAAALVVDGRVVAAAEQERFSRRKHDASFPSDAVQACLAHAGLTLEDVEAVAYYEKPLLKLDRLLETYLAYAPRGLRSFQAAMPRLAREKLFVRTTLRKALGPRFRGRTYFAEHHEAHAASAFYPSPFERAAIVTCDGVGEWTTTSIALGENDEVRLVESLSFPHSLGLLYSAFTAFCGFRVNSGEYKLMGLAPYGRPVFEKTIRERLIDLKEDGSFRLAMEHFTFPYGQAMTGTSFAALFGGAARKEDGPLTQREADLAASVQSVVTDVMVRIARRARERTSAPNLCLAGGVALNCVANGAIERAGLFDRIFVQPAAGDSGGALGAALHVHHRVFGNARVPAVPDGLAGGALGPAFSTRACEEAADALGARYERLDEANLLDRTAGALADGAVVGWFQGRMEFGPRALGFRSILADARDATMQASLNAKIKLREPFRPFAPAVRRERAGEYFDVPSNYDSPYMIVAAQVRGASPVEPRAVPPSTPLDVEGPRRALDSPIPAATHLDGSARLMTVDDARHGRFARLLSAFEARTGCPVLLNTSFNVRGEPIVCSPAEALAVFFHTELDVLVLEDLYLTKSAQPSAPRGAHLEGARAFAPD